MASPIQHAWALLKGRVSDYRGSSTGRDMTDEAMAGQPAYMKEPLHQISPAGQHSFIPPGFEQLDLGGGFGTSVRYNIDAQEGAARVARNNPNVRTIPQRYNRFDRGDVFENDASRVLGRRVPAEGYQSTLHEYDPDFMDQPTHRVLPGAGEYGQTLFEKLPPYRVPE